MAFTSPNQEPRMAESTSQKLSKETVEKVSRLARLKLTEEELAAVAKQLSVVLENFEQIAQVNTDGILPLLTPTDMPFAPREDVVEASESDKMLSNAPEKSGRVLKIAPVV
jgi:aspartyl-tRNA(Asn)/glutamyl-tRNA(Gln) amidotransferase subunit C